MNYEKEYNMPTITLTIPGKPIAKKRPRFFRRGKGVGTYNDQETEEGRFMLECKSQLNGQELLDDPLELLVLFCMPRPKGHYGTGRNAGQLKASAPEHHTVKRDDLDNLLKFTMDCLNQIVWKDDSQVVLIRAKKIYSEHPRTFIQINEARG